MAPVALVPRCAPASEVLAAEKRFLFRSRAGIARVHLRMWKLDNIVQTRLFAALAGVPCLVVRSPIHASLGLNPAASPLSSGDRAV
jgi:hypothetical protein